MASSSWPLKKQLPGATGLPLLMSPKFHILDIELWLEKMSFYFSS